MMMTTTLTSYHPSRITAQFPLPAAALRNAKREKKSTVK